jgi:DHA2 family multidrug resistance protein
VHRSQLVQHLATTNPLLQERLQRLAAWLAEAGDGSRPDQALELLSLQVDRQAALLAYGDVFRLLALVFLLAIPLVLLLGRPQPQPSSRTP